MGTLHEGLCKFTRVSRRICLRLKNILDKNCTENQNTVFCWIFFPPNFFYRLWNNEEKYDTNDGTEEMRFA